MEFSAARIPARIVCTGMREVAVHEMRIGELQIIEIFTWCIKQHSGKG